MSCEFKDEIKGLIFNNPDQDLNKAFNMRDEINHVYAQAPKSDEYEAKAKEFDHIENLVKIELTSDDLYNDARNNDYAAGMLRVYEMVDYIIDDYESGEMNVKE